MIAIFGFGSLVHAGTHAHQVRPAIAHGWRRIWREVPGQDHAILSVRPDAGARIHGALIHVPPADLPALDLREAGYARTGVTVTDLAGRPVEGAQVYVVHSFADQPARPILRSYLDVVLAGFEAQFGTDAPRDFYRTTESWHVGLRDDRAAPVYPRAQPIGADTAARYDALHRAHTG